MFKLRLSSMPTGSPRLPSCWASFAKSPPVTRTGCSGGPVSISFGRIYADRTADAPGVLDNCRAAAELMGPTLQSAPGSVAGTAVKSAWLRNVDAAIAAHLPILTARAHVRLGRPDQAQAILIDHFGTEDRAQASQPATLAMVACCQGRLQSAYRLASAALHGGEPGRSRRCRHRRPVGAGRSALRAQ